jgi:iron(III) transport system ATP-binding protein
MVTVKLDHVSKSFGKMLAVDDVSFEVGQGELFFLLGPSGCGKTTTLRVVAGFYRPDEGHVLFDGREMNSVPPHKRNIGMVFQNYALWPHMTVYDNIVYGLKARHEPAGECVRKAKEVLRIVRMEELAMRYPNQLSGGQQQRVALARALVIEPNVLLLDEPLSNLDAKLRLEMRGEIKRIQQDLRITSIYVTHDQEEAVSMADRMAIMNAGAIEQIGIPRELYNSPRNKFVAGFVGETNFISGVMDGISAEGGRCSVSLPFGRSLLAGICTSPKDGERVTCSIRPEMVEIRDRAPEEGANVFEARIVSLDYHGAVEHYLVETEDGWRVKATKFSPRLHDRKPGNKVFLSFSPEDVMIFPEGGGA